MYNLVYMAKPRYGGWISFTSHLSLKLNSKLFKITKRTETKNRPFGYGVEYQNINIYDLIELPNLIITAIDKNYYQYLKYFPDETTIIIHDPTEVKKNVSKELIKHLNRFKIITIREKVEEYLKNTFNLESRFLHHPFYKYPKTKNEPKGVVSISRIDYDKNTDIILKANKLLDDKIKIYGKKNDLYVYRKLKDFDSMNEKDIKSSYKGIFKKCFKELDTILSNSKFVIDLSSIKNDGGGTQYSFLEAIYNDNILILNKKWITPNSIFKDKFNCFAISNEFELIELLKNIDNYNLEEILKNSKIILNECLEENWNL